MKKTFKKIFAASAAALLFCGCNFLEPFPNGAYTDENFDQYPELMRGFVDHVYNSSAICPTSYWSANHLRLAAMSDECIYRDGAETARLYSNGGAKMTSYPLAEFWTNYYSGINYLNKFLVDNKGYNTRYLLNNKGDKDLRNELQGSAYGLRAWCLFNLVRVFGGVAENGQLLGVPIRTAPSEATKIDNKDVVRASYDACMEQILRDCDSAFVYLHESNKDYPDDAHQEIIVTGSARYGALDQVAINALRAYVYITWASPAVCSNESAASDRYTKAAYYASLVMKHKLEKESTLSNGFDPLKNFEWNDANSAEIVWPSVFSSGSNYETGFYPNSFGGSCSIAPTQNLVDRFPMKNGYPITDSRSGYNPAKPYENRDPRFYNTIFYDGSEVHRNTNDELMYTFEIAKGGKDASGQVNTTPTGYYGRKFTYNGWNPFDVTVEKAERCVQHFRWTQMCLIFAEAANKVSGPTAELYGYTPKQAVKWLRARLCNDGTPGLGTTSDPYLDECASSASKFEELVKNEWKIETCFEGDSFFNERRWATNVSQINVEKKKVVISKDGSNKTYTYEVEESLKYPSLWNPIPYSEIRLAPGLLQNKGWETWK